VTESPGSSAFVLHKQWAKLEDEHHELAIEIDAARARGPTWRQCASARRGSCSKSIRSSPRSGMRDYNRGFLGITRRST
jgi:hypothetical protein